MQGMKLLGTLLREFTMEFTQKEVVNVERTVFVKAVNSVHSEGLPILPERFNSTSTPVATSLVVPEFGTTSSPKESTE